MRPPRREPVTSLEVLKDNLEAFAIAIVIALVIKHFCVEAFKIPTGSMTPTLKGDDSVTGTGGDRILVDKLAYLLKDPERWHVVVFRYPLDAARNFIKRVAGLPGERLRILRGDLWVRRGDEPWRIATKPRRPRDELTTDVWPPAAGVGSQDAVRRALESAFESDRPGAWRTEALDRFEFTGGAPAALRYEPAIHTSSNALSWNDDGRLLVRDARFRATFLANEPAVCSMSWRSGDDVVAEVRFASEGAGESSAAAVRRGEDSVAEVRLDRELRLVPGKPLDVEMECVDGELIVSTDGREVARLSLGRRIDEREDYGRDSQRFLLRASGGPVTVRHFAIGRDLWYLEGGTDALDPEHDGIEIPDDGYFMLGDNTGQSSDSRKWFRDCLFLRDGRRICWDGSKSGSSSEPETWKPGQEGRPPADLLHRGGTLRHVVDVAGVERWWLQEDEDPERAVESTNLPFVRRSMIVGRAFFIFWPVLPGFPGRLRFIH